MDSLVPLMSSYDPSDVGWITDPDLDHLSGTYPLLAMDSRWILLIPLERALDRFSCSIYHSMYCLVRI